MTFIRIDDRRVLKITIYRTFRALARIVHMAHRKPHLPSKICPICDKPFTWRKKWERVWDEVKYCSERCRRASKGKSSA